MTSIFLDVGHAFGAKSGAVVDNLREEDYNIEIRNRVLSVIDARVALNQLLENFDRHIREIGSLVKDQLYQLVVSDWETKHLLGTYAERQHEAAQWGLTAYVQMHLNAGKGKYGLIGFPHFGKFERESEQMAQIFAEVYKAQLDMAGKADLLSQIQIWPVNSMDSDSAHRRIASCLSATQYPAILIEPWFLDNPEHFQYFVTDDGRNLLARTYLFAMDRIAEEVLDKVEEIG